MVRLRLVDPQSVPNASHQPVVSSQMKFEAMTIKIVKDMLQLYVLRSADDVSASTPDSSIVEPGPPAGDETPVPKSFEEILNTYSNSNWNHALITTTAMAEAGLCFIGPRDRVKCYECLIIFDNWEANDNPMFNHRSASPQCSAITNYFAIDKGEKLQNLCLRANPIDCTAFVKLLNSVAVPLVNIALRKYANIETRRESFVGREEEMAVDLGALSDAGFFYVGNANNRGRAACFCCFQGLSMWQVGEDPWTEHAKYSPNCKYLLLCMGRPFVRRTRLDRFVVDDDALVDNEETLCPSTIKELELHTAENSSNSGSNSDSSSSSSSSSNNSSSNYGSKSINLESSSSSSSSSSADESGSNDVGRCCPGLYNGQGPSVAICAGRCRCPDSRTDVAGVIDICPDSRTDVAGVIDNESPYPESPEEESLEKTMDRITKEFTKELTAESTAETSAESTAESTAETSEDQQEASVAEKIENVIPDSIRCKICFLEEVQVALIPCAHLIICTKCVLTNNRCPICRKKYFTAVRAFLNGDTETELGVVRQLCSQAQVPVNPLLCKACNRNEANVVLLPCRHMCACSACAMAMRQCPECSLEYPAFMPVFL